LANFNSTWEISPWIHLKALVTGHQLCRVLLHSCLLIIGIDRSAIQLRVVV